MFDFLKRAWGSSQPKRFKIAAWVTAFSVFGVWQYVDNQKKLKTEADPMKPHPSFVKKA